jgi:heme exporter protein A
MRQRLRIAAARLHAPPLLLLDEPSATMDEAGRALVRALLDTPAHVVLATNDPDEAALCPRSLSLGGGGER